MYLRMSRGQVWEKRATMKKKDRHTETQAGQIKAEDVVASGVIMKGVTYDKGPGQFLIHTELKSAVRLSSKQVAVFRKTFQQKKDFHFM